MAAAAAAAVGHQEAFPGVAGVLAVAARVVDGRCMKTKEFLAHVDDAQVLAAIEAAELKSSGEIRLFVSNEMINEPIPAAQAQFEKLGMTRTKNRNGVLLFFAPKTQRFAVIGDQGIHEKCGQEFWDETRALIAERLKAGQYTEALVAAIQRIGDVLAKHFPRVPGDINELPNQIARD